MATLARWWSPTESVGTFVRTRMDALNGLGSVLTLPIDLANVLWVHHYQGRLSMPQLFRGKEIVNLLTFAVEIFSIMITVQAYVLTSNLERNMTNMIITPHGLRQSPAHLTTASVRKFVTA